MLWMSKLPKVSLAYCPRPRGMSYLNDQERRTALREVRPETNEESTADEHALVGRWNGLDDHADEDENDANLYSDPTAEPVCSVGG